MDISAQVDKRDVQRVFRVLKKVEPDAVKELKNQLVPRLKPLAAKIASQAPASSPIDNFNVGYWKWRYGKVTGKVSFTPGSGRKGAAGRTSLVSLSMSYKDTDLGVRMLEFIGRRKEFTPSGKALYDAINRRLPGWPNGGRLFYSKFVGSAHVVKVETVGIINKWSEQVSQKLDSK